MVANIQRAAIEIAIQNKLLGITGIENVYTHRKRIQDVQALIDELVTADSSTIHAWLISRISSDPHTAESNHGQVDIRTHVHYYHSFQVELFIGYQNDDPNTGLGTEDTIQTLTDTVLNNFAEERTLGAWNSAKPLGLISIAPERLSIIEGQRALFSITLIDDQSGLAPH